jgi:hypothetical protein
MKYKMGKQLFTAVLGSITVLSASSELLYAATTPSDKENPAAQDPVTSSNPLPAQLAEKTTLSPEIVVLPVADQEKLQKSLDELKKQYGDDVMNRAVFKYDGGQLKIIGVQKKDGDADAEPLSTNPSCT